MSDDVLQIIVNKDVGKLVQVAESIGAALSRSLSTNQIRNIFGEVRRIQMKWPVYRANMTDAEQQNAKNAFRQTVLLRPKLAYQASRERGRGVEDLRNVLDPCLKLIQDAKDDKQRKEYFDRFVDFFEAILAYHRSAGGK